MLKPRPFEILNSHAALSELLAQRVAERRDRLVSVALPERLESVRKIVGGLIEISRRIDWLLVPVLAVLSTVNPNRTASSAYTPATAAPIASMPPLTAARSSGLS